MAGAGPTGVTPDEREAAHVRAVVIERFGEPATMRDVPEPTCPEDGALIRVRATGVCRSDWHAWTGHAGVTLPHVPGHEFAGTVEQVGPQVRRVRVGDRVTVPFVCACGSCSTCLAGAEQVCERQVQPGFDTDGSFAELVAVRWADLNAVPLPEGMSFAVAASLGCRFATAYRAVTGHARVTAGQHVVVLGCGGVGLATVMIAASRGAHVVAVDVSEPALELARRLGATDTVRSTDPVARVRELTGGGAHASFDTLGSADTCIAGIRSLRPRGRHVQVGLLAGAAGRPPVPMSFVIAHELEIFGSHGMAARDYPAMLAEIADGTLDPAALVGEHIALDDIAGADGALARMSSGSPLGIQVALLGG